MLLARLDLVGISNVLTVPFRCTGAWVSRERKTTAEVGASRQPLRSIKPPRTRADWLRLLHSLWGSPSHLNQLVKALHTVYPGDQLHTLVTKRNSGNFTYDGIETGGERVTHEVEDEILSLEKEDKIVTKISVVGYSLGGLIARYAIGLLYSKGYFDHITPTNFTTFATPHLGTRTPLLGWNNQIFNVMGARTLSTSGQQLWLIDNFRDTERPLLAIMADPGSVFMCALAAFKHRSLYANIVNDRAVPFYTACISPIDPFTDLDSLDVNYVPNTECVILQHPHGDDVTNNVMATPKTGPRTYYEAFSNGARNAWNKAPFYFFLTTFAPIGIIAFMTNAGVQSFRSAQRIKEHEEGRAATDFSKYRLPLMIEGARHRAEQMFSHMNHHQEPDTTEGYSDDSGSERKDTSATSSNGSETANANGNGNGHAKTSSKSSTSPPNQQPEIQAEHLPHPTSSTTTPESDSRALVPAKDASPFPTLALTPAQFDMVRYLDDVGFRKYPVHIQRANHSHAAIIVRMQRPGFGEGRIVSRHWVERFEI